MCIDFETNNFIYNLSTCITMVQAIIFDLGGVYFSAGTKIACGKLIKEFQEINSEKIHALIRTGAIAKKYRYGKLTKKEFWKKVVQIAGKQFDVQKFSNIWNSSYEINKEVEAIVKKLKKKYKVAALTGNTRERIKFLEHKYNFKKNFDILVCSYMVGTNKPDPKMYREVVKRLKVPASECVFIDDSKKTLKPAKQLGMKVIHFQDAKQLKRKLKLYRVKLN